jgi:urease accessory protein
VEAIARLHDGGRADEPFCNPIPRVKKKSDHALALLLSLLQDDPENSHLLRALFVISLHGQKQEAPVMIRIALAVLLVFFPVTAFAHVGVGGASGLAHGFSHPISGVDHVLAMVAVGLFAAHLSGRALWLVPAAFLSVMALAGMLGMAGLTLPVAEIGIGLSVVVLGLVIAFELNLSTIAAMALVGVFAIFHGHAHGAEMPESVPGLTYGAGFVCATALLHAIGIGLGLLIGRAGPIYSRRIVQAGGGAMALAGVSILTGII